MNTQNDARQKLLDEIIERELKMFLSTPNQGGQASCQQRPDSFRMMRWMAHAIHSEASLLSYLADLEQAESLGRNFMIEKYARMDNLIPALTHNPLVQLIAEAEHSWLCAAAQKYPLFFHNTNKNQGAGPQTGDERAMFKRYLSCELETLSDQTLEHYYNEVLLAQKEGRNLVEDRHDLLCQRMGFSSLAEHEAAHEAEHEQAAAKSQS